MRKIKFSLENTNCCGMFMLTRIEQQPASHYDWYSRKTVKYPSQTPEKAFMGFEEELHSQLIDQVDGNGGFKGGYMVQATLVTSYGEKNYSGKKEGEQEFPELQEYMLANGWEVVQEWVNSNSSNKVGLFMKYYDFEQFRDEVHSDYDDEEENEEDYDEFA